MIWVDPPGRVSKGQKSALKRHAYRDNSGSVTAVCGYHDSHPNHNPNDLTRVEEMEFARLGNACENCKSALGLGGVEPSSPGADTVDFDRHSFFQEETNSSNGRVSDDRNDDTAMTPAELEEANATRGVGTDNDDSSGFIDIVWVKCPRCGEQKVNCSEISVGEKVVLDVVCSDCGLDDKVPLPYVTPEQ